MEKTRIYQFGNNYIGTQYQLSGCENDINNLITKVQSFCDIKATTLLSNEIDMQNVLAVFDEALERWQKDKVKAKFQNSGHGTDDRDITGKERDGRMEGWVLNIAKNEILWDYELHERLMKFPIEAGVCVIDDSCHSAGSGSVRGAQKSKYIKLANLNYDVEGHRTKRRSISRNMGLPYAYWAACGEDQTSADATFNRHANGAFTYYLLKYLNAKDSMKQIHRKISRNLPSGRFAQRPQLYGNAKIYNQPLIF